MILDFIVLVFIRPPIKGMTPNIYGIVSTIFWIVIFILDFVVFTFPLWVTITSGVMVFIHIIILLYGIRNVIKLRNSINT